MKKEEKEKAQRALTFLTEKNDGTIKGRTVYNVGELCDMTQILQIS